MNDRQLFIGNLCNISSDILRAYCEKFGTLTELSINRDKENNVYHCFAFVTFKRTHSTSDFMSNRPHIINGDEIFVKRALPRLIASIPERLIVTNRLILQDPYPQDKSLLQNYFRKYGRIKNIDLDNGIIDYEDYDDVDRVLLARPHYIRDKEISVTKYSPDEQQEDSDNHHHHHQRFHRRHRSKHHNHNEPPERIIRFSKHSEVQQNHLENVVFDQEMMNHNGKEEEEEDGEINGNDSSIRCEQLEEQFQEYKQAKEIEICSLRMDLERTKQQLADLTQEKLDILIKNQQLFHSELTLRLFPERISMQTQTIDDFHQSPSKHSNKKRKLSLSPSIDREFDYYS